MSIPVNTTNIDAISEQAEVQFREEIDTMENYAFGLKWEKEYNAEFLTLGEFGMRYKFPYITKAHWDTLIDNIKKAGYFVYRKWYHNGHYGTTEFKSLVVSKAPLSLSQREHLSLQSEWGKAWGPGRECYRGEQL